MSNVSTTGNYTFKGCENLTSVTFSEALISIESGAFSGCKNLSEVVIPENTRFISSKAFEQCVSLTNVTFNGTPTSIYADAFTGTLATLTINAPWPEGAVSNAPWGATEATINYDYTLE